MTKLQLFEGGNAIKDNSQIPLENVQPTIDAFLIYDFGSDGGKKAIQYLRSTVKALSSGVDSNGAGVVTLTEQETKNLMSLIDFIEENVKLLEDFLSEFSKNRELILALKTFESQSVKQGVQFDKNPENYVRRFLDWIANTKAETKKINKGKASTLDELSSIIKFFIKEYKEETELLFVTQAMIVNLKNTIIKKLSDGFEVTDQEGFNVSDANGNTVKLGDRSEFTKTNLDPDTAKGRQRPTNEVSENVKKFLLSYLVEKNVSSLEDIEKILNDYNLVPKAGEELRPKKRSYVVIDPENNRYAKAKKIADEWEGKIGEKPSIVNLDNNYILILKNQKTAAGNEGNKFEREVADNLLTNKAVIDILKNRFKINLEEHDIEVEELGYLNVRRTLQFNLLPDKLLSLPNNVKEGEYAKIGKALADVAIIIDGEKRIYVSVKHGPTVSFINSGLGGKNKWEETVIGICEAIGGIDTERVLIGFQSYEAKDALSKRIRSKDDFEAPISKVNVDNLTLFMNHAIGENYIMVHDDHVYYMDSSKREQLTRNPQIIGIKYPNKDRKKLVVKFSTDGLIVDIDIRNTQGGILPDKILAMYKEK